MGRYIEKAGDGAQYVIGVPLFVAVSAVTATIMAVGFGTITVIQRLIR